MTNAFVQIFCCLVEDDVQSLFSSPGFNKCYSSLSPQDKQALEDLSYDPTLKFSSEIRNS